MTWAARLAPCLFVIAFPATALSDSKREIGGPIPITPPAEAGFDPQRLQAIGPLIETAIAEKRLPGAVVLLGRGQKVVYRRAFGSRSLLGAGEPMSEQTIFDLASLTKPVATAASVWALIEAGKLRLTDRAGQFVPAFGERRPGANETEAPLLLHHLLTHTAGLSPYLDVSQLKAEMTVIDPSALVDYIAHHARSDPPGTVFRYSCLGYITLGVIVQKASGMDLGRFASDRVFAPLGMSRTSFVPPGEWRGDVAPTEVVEGTLLRGVVHDPLARLIGGVSGNAGLFSTADDLARFAMMLLAEGRFEGRVVFSPLTVRAFTRVSPLSPQFGRSPGFDVATDYSSPRGDLLSLDSFGHSGFTGTSIWIDRGTGVFVIFLSNAVHPEGKGDVVRLRGLLANLAAAGLVRP